MSRHEFQLEAVRSNKKIQEEKSDEEAAERTIRGCLTSTQSIERKIFHSVIMLINMPDYLTCTLYIDTNFS